MNNNWLNGHEVPIIDRGQIAGNPEPQFAKQNEELQGSMGSEMRKSELVEIPTTTARVIYKIQAMFPFDFFPDQVVIDEIKVGVTFKSFVTQQMDNILIKDITDIMLNSSLFFGSLRITGGEYEGSGAANEDEKGPLIISKLRLGEARTARKVILGLMVLSDQKVDTTQMSVEEIFKKTTELGNG